jgi:hypothetical protein
VVAGVQHLVRDLVLLQEGRQHLRLLDADGAHQHRLLTRPGLLDQLDDRVVFLLGGPIDLVVVILAHAGQVGRDFDHLEPVDVHEFRRLGHRRARHARQLRVHAEVVLEGDGGVGRGLPLDLHPFLGLERLVQALRIAPTRHHAAGEFVDDDDLAVLHDVVGVAAEQLVGAQRLRDVMDQRDVVEVVEMLAPHQVGLAQHLLDVLGALLGQRDLLVLFVLLEILGHELGDERVHADVELRRVVHRAGDDQRRARLVDQDAVDLVDDRVVEVALDHLVEPELHVVAQIVEAELVVGAVGDVAGIGLAPLGIVEPRHDAADGHAQELIDLPHPFGVAAGQIVIDRDDMDAVALERVEVDGEGGHQRLAFAGLHLADHAAVEHHAAHELDVEMALTEGALGGLPHRRESVRQDVVEGFALAQALLQLLRPRSQLVIRQLRDRRLQGVDLVGGFLQALDVAIVGGAEESLREGGDIEHPLEQLYQ